MFRRSRDLALIGRLAVPALIAALLWAIFVATAKPHEMIVGAICVVATISFLMLISQRGTVVLQLRMNDLGQGLRIPGYILCDVGVVTLVLLKDILHIAPAQDLFRVCGFDSSKRDPIRMTRTVLAVAYTSASPNTIVLGVDVARSRMLFHQISRGEVQAMTKALGAKG